jgi:pyruvate formate lyase activating enzyme
MKGRIFSIEEFAVYDGPGIRTTVFFKGCHMRCNWCHNPEGVAFEREAVRSPNGCPRCDELGTICPVCREKALANGLEIDEKAKGLIRISGEDFEPDELAVKLLKNVDILNMNHGGITFTGGEPLAQPDFLFQVLSKLKGKTHLMMETSGYCDMATFMKIVSMLDLLIIDMKIIDSELAYEYEGINNAPIIKNYEVLKMMDVPFIARVPLIPGVVDTQANIDAIIGILKSAKNLLWVELLPYNKMAGSKHASIGQSYHPLFDETQESRICLEDFEKAGLKAKVL